MTAKGRVFPEEDTVTAKAYGRVRKEWQGWQGSGSKVSDRKNSSTWGQRSSRTMGFQFFSNGN